MLLEHECIVEGRKEKRERKVLHAFHFYIETLMCTWYQEKLMINCF